MEMGPFVFHNVSQLSPLEGYPGLRLQRFPEELRQATNLDVADLCRSVEIRFTLEKEQPVLSGGRVYLMARDGDGEAMIFWGDYQARQVIPLPKGVITPVPVVYPDALDQMPRGRFANRVCRIFLNTRSAVQYMGYEYLKARPPRTEDLPSRVLVGYGSSITHGGVARSNCNCYLQLTARMLGMDALNLGLSGSCLGTAAFADHLAEKVAGDVFFIELGANMIGGFSVEEYRARCDYTLQRVAAAHPEALVLATGCYPAGALLKDQKRAAYNETMEACVRELALTNLHFVHPDDLLADLTWLSEDALHPSDFGHVQMANTLTGIIRKLTAKP